MSKQCKVLCQSKLQNLFWFANNFLIEINNIKNKVIFTLKVFNRILSSNCDWN